MALTESTAVTTTRVSCEVNDVDAHHDLCKLVAIIAADAVGKNAWKNYKPSRFPFYSTRLVANEWIYPLVFEKLRTRFRHKALVVMSVDRLDGEQTMFITFYWRRR